MQRSNLAAVLRLIYENADISRKEIAARTGLTPATVTNIVSHLMRYDYLTQETTEGGPQEGTAAPGRRPIALRINRARHSIAGIELSADSIAAVVTDFCGGVLARGQIGNDSGNTPRRACSLAWELTRRLLREAGRTPQSLLGIGLMSSGPYDRETGVLFDPPNFHGDAWKKAPVCALLEECSGVPVYFDRDSVGCALAELGDGAAGEGKTLFAVMVNTVGIGGGLLIGSEVHYGLSNSAAEIGHLTVVPDGPQCGCGDRGCLEAVSSGEAIARALSRREGGEVSVARLIERYRAGEEAAVEAVRYGARCLGLAIGNIIKCVGPDCVVLGGRFISMLPEYYELARDCASGRRYIKGSSAVQILPFTHGEIQSAMGGVRLVLNNFFKSLRGE